VLKCSADKVAPPTAGIHSEYYRTVPNGGDVAQKGVPRGRSPEAGRKATPTGHRRKLDDGAGYSTWTAQLTPLRRQGTSVRDRVCVAGSIAENEMQLLAAV